MSDTTLCSNLCRAKLLGKAASFFVYICLICCSQCTAECQVQQIEVDASGNFLTGLGQIARSQGCDFLLRPSILSIVSSSGSNPGLTSDSAVFGSIDPISLFVSHYDCSCRRFGSVYVVTPQYTDASSTPFMSAAECGLRLKNIDNALKSLISQADTISGGNTSSVKAFYNSLTSQQKLAYSGSGIPVASLTSVQRRHVQDIVLDIYVNQPMSTVDLATDVLTQSQNVQLRVGHSSIGGDAYLCYVLPASGSDHAALQPLIDLDHLSMVTGSNSSFNKYRDYPTAVSPGFDTSTLSPAQPLDRLIESVTTPGLTQVVVSAAESSDDAVYVGGNSVSLSDLANASAYLFSLAERQVAQTYVLDQPVADGVTLTNLNQFVRGSIPLPY